MATRKWRWSKLSKQRRRRMMPAPVLRRRRILTLIGFLGVALLCWGGGVMLFPMWGDKAFYLALVALVAIGVGALLVLIRPGALPDAPTSD